MTEPTGTSIVALSQERSVRRQIARALSSGGMSVRFVSTLSDIDACLKADPPNLLIVDGDNLDHETFERGLGLSWEGHNRVPVILLSHRSDKATLLDLLRLHEVDNLVVKRGSVWSAHPVIDEAELLVTVQKVLGRDIFGVEKYVGGWGVHIHRVVLKSTGEKETFLDSFEQYLLGLGCSPSLIPDILTVADELILNAMIHAPHDGQGRPKYESMDPANDLSLEPREYTHVAYGCDGGRLMLSVSDNFGRLNRQTVYSYLSRLFGPKRLTAETKPGGAGLGLSMAFLNVHQMIFNIQESIKIEALAGWNLRLPSALEFRQAPKTLNVFWLPDAG